MTTTKINSKQKEAIGYLRLIKKHFRKIEGKAWKGNVITVGESNDARMLLKYTFASIEGLIKSLK